MIPIDTIRIQAQMVPFRSLQREDEEEENIPPEAWAKRKMQKTFRGSTQCFMKFMQLLGYPLHKYLLEMCFEGIVTYH